MVHGLAVCSERITFCGADFFRVYKLVRGAGQTINAKPWAPNPMYRVGLLPAVFCFVYHELVQGFEIGFGFRISGVGLRIDRAGHFPAVCWKTQNTKP